MPDQIPPPKFGAFIIPYHAAGDNPNLAVHRILDMIEHFDYLGFEEAWVGEHHSGGWEIVAAPEIVLAAAAERTKRIRLGTGVSTVAYHHPLTLTERMVLLDHISRGRAIFGLGSGALIYDAAIFGVDPNDLRRRLGEGLEAVLDLLRAKAPISRRSDWYEMNDAFLQLPPYSDPHMEIAVASFATPTGPQLTGRLGVSLLSIGVNTAAAYEALNKTWGIVEESAAAAGRVPDRRTWRVLGGPMHIAETVEQAMEDVRFGLTPWVKYVNSVMNFKLLPDAVGKPEETYASIINETGFGVIGTPEMAVQRIQSLIDRSGGFGTFLLTDHEWANRDATKRSYELIARRVIPAIQSSARAATLAYDRAAGQHDALVPSYIAAQQKSLNAYGEAKKKK